MTLYMRIPSGLDGILCFNDTCRRWRTDQALLFALEAAGARFVDGEHTILARSPKG
jgi:hypothetical protein